VIWYEPIKVTPDGSKYLAIEKSVSTVMGINKANTLRLRAAWGRSGVHPGPLDGLEYYSPTPVVVNNVDVPGFTIGNLGNQNLKPERTNEVEVGFEAALFQDLAHLDVAYYNKSSRDALIAGLRG